MSAKLPGCNVIVGQSLAFGEDATFTLEAENILSRISLRCKSQINLLAEFSLSLAGVLESDKPIKYSISGDIYSSGELHLGKIPELTYSLFHLPKPE